MLHRFRSLLVDLLAAEATPAVRIALVAGCVGLTLVTATVRFSLEEHLRVSLTLLPPIMLVAWYVGMGWGLGAACVVVLSWLPADLLAITPPAPSWVAYVNAGVRAGVFGLIAALVAALRAAYRQQRLLATQDALTGLGNRHRFMAVAEIERQRATRFGHALALAYLDLDGFKAVNDALGHAQGDEVLRVVGRFLHKRLRSIDHAARLGGDEFVVLLPASGVQAGARGLADVHQGLIDALRHAGFAVGVSAGIAIFPHAPPSVAAMLQAADRLMYQAKLQGKSQARQAVIGGGEAQGASVGSAEAGAHRR
jgi:diguanylate cyclase (GGDEF)-like protein